MEKINEIELTAEMFEFAEQDFKHVEDIQGQSLSFYADAFARFKQNKAAVISFFAFIIILVIALISPLLGGYHNKVEVNSKVYANTIGDYTNNQYANLPPKVPFLEKIGIADGKKMMLICMRVQAWKRERTFFLVLISTGEIYL